MIVVEIKFIGQCYSILVRVDLDLRAVRYLSISYWSLTEVRIFIILDLLKMTSLVILSSTSVSLLPMLVF